jgi:hypothetical protein
LTIFFEMIFKIFLVPLMGGTFMRSMAVVVACILMVASPGCGGGGPAPAKLYSVSGKVTVANKPLADCTVQFVAVGKEGAFSGKIAADGGYSLVSLKDGRSGAEAGKYKVVLQMSPEAQMKLMAQQSGPPIPGQGAPFPAEYASVETSTKEVEVKAESNTINIEIP